ncbi:chemotaxis protein CheW [Usitatibacter palustris]|uniref:Chemotaxis protein CheW n=1 Tax=Usitatibacter palustris TaxID=2732487 RepID=A0A6M4H5W8_9PROT|nr:chemotaxis protein CheW [Usitatibacter palustris]QJR15041.1 Chemotaxis protein CheW [Usitatibacter palustris]
MAAPVQPRAGAAGAAGREVLVFLLGKEEYGVDILKVQEIRGYEKVTAIASAPDYLKGVINLRGTIVPVIDLRIKFGKMDPQYDSLTVVIILRLARRVIGVVVDGVSDVIRLAENEVRAAPAFGGMVNAEYLGGVGVQDGRMVLLFDIERFLSSNELRLLEQAAENPA